MQTADTNYIYKNELDKVYFQHDMNYGGFEDLKRRKALKDKAFKIESNLKYD